jgi:predicted DNA-binding WGR domain protein/cell wall assembly regulator SMI1
MASNVSRSLEFHEGSSNKFWTIKLDGSKHIIEFGRVGTKGQQQSKSFDSPGAAREAFDKLVAEKLKKGYHDVGAALAVPEPASAAAENTAIRDVLKKLEAFLKETDPDMLKALRPPATPKQLEKLSKAVFNSKPVPADLAEWFGWHNGQKGSGELLNDRTFGLESIDEAIEEFEGMRGWKPDPGVTKRWEPDWLPLFDNGGGDYMAFVTGRDEHGAIKKYFHDDDDDAGVETEFASLQELAEAALAMRQEAARPIPRVTVKLDVSKAEPLKEISPQIVQRAQRGTLYFGKMPSGKFLAIMLTFDGAWWAYWGEGPLEPIVHRVVELAETNDTMHARAWPAAADFMAEVLKSNPGTARVVVAEISR